MAEFRYVVKDKRGKSMTGHKMASSKDNLILELGRKNFTIVSVEEVRRQKIVEKITKVSVGRGKISTFELIVFCRQLATMLQGGVPILRAIESIAFETKDKKFKQILSDISRDLGEGKLFSESLKKHPNAFSNLATALVEAGERVGAMDDMLRRLSGYFEFEERLRRKMVSVTLYPSVIAGFFAISVVIVTLFLVPRFQEVYDGFNAKLPPLTQIIFNTTDMVINNAAVFFGVVFSLIFLLYFVIKHTRKGKFIVDSMLLKIPLFGPVLTKAAISKFSRTMATLLGQGIPVTEAFLLLGRTSGNLVIENASTKASRLIMEGETIPDAMDKMKIFPPLMLQMASVGAEAGSLPDLMDKTADFYEEQVDMFISTLMTLIEPILIVGLGLFIGVIVVALYMPIFTLGSAVSGGM